MTTAACKQQLNNQGEYGELKELMEQKIKLNSSLKNEYIRAKNKIKMLMFERNLLLDGIARLNPHSSVHHVPNEEEATQGARYMTCSLSETKDIATVPSAPPKRSRINKHTVKTRRVQPIQRDSHGNPLLPQKIGVLTVTNLGKIVTNREAFHNERYIFPVGYTVQRIYPSMIDPTRNTLVTSTVIDGGVEGGGGAPKFHVVAADQSSEPIVANSATGAWTVVVRKSNEIRQRDHSNSASGPDYFGFKHPTIAKMIQDLPGARKLKNYIWQNFEEMDPRAAKGVMAAAEKKRDHLKQHNTPTPQQKIIRDPMVIMEQKSKNDCRHYYDPPRQQPSSHASQYSAYYHHHNTMNANIMHPFIKVDSDEEMNELDANDSG